VRAPKVSEVSLGLACWRYRPVVEVPVTAVGEKHHYSPTACNIGPESGGDDAARCGTDIGLLRLGHVMMFPTVFTTAWPSDHRSCSQDVVQGS